MLDALRSEVVGPCAIGTPIEISPGQQVSVPAEGAWSPKKQANGEEILWQDPPLKRYGAGILFPQESTIERELAADTEAIPDRELAPEADRPLTGEDERGLASLEKLRNKTAGFKEGDDDDATTGSNLPQPSSVGLTFLFDGKLESDGLLVELVDIRRKSRDSSNNECVFPAVYKPASLMQASAGSGGVHERKVWLRVPLRAPDGRPIGITLSGKQLCGDQRQPARPVPTDLAALELKVLVRADRESPGRRLITVTLVNREKFRAKDNDSLALFQAGFRVRSLSGASCIRPYPRLSVLAGKGRRPQSRYDDDAVNELLYRSSHTFATGHGCAADWSEVSDGGVSSVWTSSVPAWEIPSTSPDFRIGGVPVRISMRLLAGLDAEDDGARDVEALIGAYRTWVQELERRVSDEPTLRGEYQDTACGVAKRARECLGRIEEGWRWLNGPEPQQATAREAFRLANHAMLLSQLHAAVKPRKASVERGRLQFDPPFPNIEERVPNERVGYWRPFQIAFLLMSIRGMCLPGDPERKIVDLIWFPTGGGKTEAYLGLTAFTLLWARLSGQRRTGADVIMRYTLRLLTAQQYQRASTLFCSLEHLRARVSDERLGQKTFRIGLWVGGTTTPNTRKDAISALKKLEDSEDAENPFILRRCPWCGAEFGLVGARRDRQMLGYYRESLNGSENTVVLRCPDTSCDFGPPVPDYKPPLPVLLVDEDIYDEPPAMVIGTVDKFALLTWKPEARSIFGIGDDGWHADGCEPPALILQDELHLISGPLGSMVGAYEGLIEALCRVHDFRRVPDPESWPKIVASTATISRAYEQVHALYAREEVALFPPPGLEASDSFFARYEQREDGSLASGRLYVGIFAPGHGSLQTTQARVFSALMQEPALLGEDPSTRDPWWTLLCFFNSLRELGSAGTLFLSDVADYLKVVALRLGVAPEKRRMPYRIEELTSRIPSGDIPEVLQRLERSLQAGPRGDAEVFDACLASNIIEVGVDVQRLALMCLVGQPKTMSQYIQVSSRVGRSRECPGMAVVLYGTSKPRDRSHYERFRSDHERLYAAVEPTSVTPFSIPAVERALHGVLVAAVRQMGARATAACEARPIPFSLGNDGARLRAFVEALIVGRAEQVLGSASPKELEFVKDTLAQRLDDWAVRSPPLYGQIWGTPLDIPLIFPAGMTPPPAWKGRGWPTMTSMREVDATCEASVTQDLTLRR